MLIRLIWRKQALQKALDGRKRVATAAVKGKQPDSPNMYFNAMFDPSTASAGQQPGMAPSAPATGTERGMAPGLVPVGEWQQLRQGNVRQRVVSSGGARPSSTSGAQRSSEGGGRGPVLLLRGRHTGSQAGSRDESAAAAECAHSEAVEVHLVVGASHSLRRSTALAVRRAPKLDALEAARIWNQQAAEVCGCPAAWRHQRPLLAQASARGCWH